MNKFTKAVCLAAAALTSVSASAGIIDNHDFDVTEGVTIAYWNDFKDNSSASDFNQIYPNWRVSVKDSEVYGEGTKGVIKYTYTNEAGEVVKEGTQEGTIGSDGTYHNWLNLGVLENGDYTIAMDVTLTTADGVSATYNPTPFTFAYKQVEVDPSTPTAELTWSVESGINEAYFVYNVETENIDLSKATVRVWADRPGNNTAAESTEWNGKLVIKFNIPEGTADGATLNETLWVKCEVKYVDAEGEEKTLVAKGNDTGVGFSCTYNIEAGVSAIEAAAGDAVYYNLQGVRVANPEKGLYIRVANGKSSKVRF